MYDEFEALDTVVIAIAQEDDKLETHARMLSNFKPAPRFEIAADLERIGTERYERTSTYLIDKQGVVRQIFPQLVTYRATWDAILPELKRQLQEKATTQPAE